MVWGELQEWEGSVGEEGLTKSGRAQQLVVQWQAEGKTS